MDEVRVGESGSRMVFQSADGRADKGSAKAIIQTDRKPRNE